MRRRRTTAELFGLSFLDVLTCALGAVLLLLLLTTDRRAQEAAAADTRARNLQAQLDGVTKALAEGNARWEQRWEALTDELQQAQKALDDALDDAERSEQEIAQRRKDMEQARRRFEEQSRTQLEEMQKLHATLIGLKGDLSHVVFVFDTSGSMKNWRDPRTGDPRFPEYKAFLQAWVRDLKFETFNVVRFSDKAERWKPQDMPATPEHRQQAIEWIENFEADGYTNTRQAFEKAFADPNVTTIIFFSDGEPTDPQGARTPQDLMRDVLSELRDKNSQRGVTVNTVGMGDYFKEAYGAFLQKIADDHGGVFIGR